MFLRVSERIESNPRVGGGQPVVKGTRVSVATVLEQLAAGESWDSLLHGYPELRRVDIQAVLDYARRAVLHMDTKRVYAAMPALEHKLREAKGAKELDCPPDSFTEPLED
jgi:uncharacterized protein (DUF433 family)